MQDKEIQELIEKIKKYANDAVKFISCGKIKNLIFQKKFVMIEKNSLVLY